MNFVLLYAAAAVSAFTATLAALPLWRKACLRFDLVDEPGHRKDHGEPVPLAGGLAVMTALVATTVLALVALRLQIPPLDSPTVELLTHGLRRRAVQLAGILFGGVGMLVVGLLDDRHELRPATKFAAQFGVALLVAACGVRITLFVPNLIFSYAVTVLWVLTMINAFNFMDNMNGLCAGLGAIGAFYFAAIAGAAGQYLVALVASLTCGALLGFLPYNYPRAKAFLGDAGSHLVGYLLAILAILPHFYTPKQPRVWAVLSPLLVLAVPLGDMIWVVLLRARMGKPFYIGDTNHLSHRLVRTGLSRTRAVLVIWMAALVIGALALL